MNVPYYDSITFKVNGSRIEERNRSNIARPSDRRTKFRAALTELRETTREAAAAASAPKVARTCPFCGATTTPDASGRCEYRGGAMGA